MADSSWTERAEPKASALLEIGFLLSKSFYFGDDNDIAQINDERYREPLYQPQVDLYGDYLLSQELEVAFDEAVSYYLGTQSCRGRRSILLAAVGPR